MGKSEEEGWFYDALVDGFVLRQIVFKCMSSCLHVSNPILNLFIYLFFTLHQDLLFLHSVFLFPWSGVLLFLMVLIAKSVKTVPFVPTNLQCTSSCTWGASRASSAGRLGQEGWTLDDGAAGDGSPMTRKVMLIGMWQVEVLTPSWSSKLSSWDAQLHTWNYSELLIGFPRKPYSKLIKLRFLKTRADPFHKDLLSVCDVCLCTPQGWIWLSIL